MGALSLRSPGRFNTMRAALGRLGPGATAGNVFSVINQSGSFQGGFVETYSEARPWEASHAAIEVPEELTHIIMQRPPHEPQPALDSVSRARVGSLTCDRHALTDDEWRRVEGYQALQVFGFGQAAALKLSTAGRGARREHMYLALFRASDARSISDDEQALLEALHPTIRKTLQRLATPLLVGTSMLAQIVREQYMGAMSLSPSRSIRDANARAHALALRYGPVLGVGERVDVLRSFLDKLLALPVDPSDGRRRFVAPREPCYLEVTVHQLDAEAYDLPEHRLLVLLKENRSSAGLAGSDDRFERLSPAPRRIAQLLVETGLSYKEIADTVGVREGTVRTQVEHIYRAYNVHSRPELGQLLRAPQRASGK